MTATPDEHPWSSDALLSKAVVYADKMHGHSADDWEFGFWSALGLELLARAALAHISPTLLADGKDWQSIHYALGGRAIEKKFKPTSIGTARTLDILHRLLPDFRKELHDFAGQHIGRRNAELHSAEEVFAGLRSSLWLPEFYAACEVLLKSMDKGLSDMFPDAQGATEMIASLQDVAAKSVQKDINSHHNVWENSSEKERADAVAQATAWATRQRGHRVECPACGSPGLVIGTAHGTVSTDVDEITIHERQPMLPAEFRCIACKLRIVGFSKLKACGLGDVFTATSSYDVAEYFELYTQEELDRAREEATEEALAGGWDEDYND